MALRRNAVTAATTTTAMELHAPVQYIGLERIAPSKTNPRKLFVGIEALAEDIRQHGVLQSVLVRPKGGAYELVVGERRYRAAKQAGLEAIPAMVRELGDDDAAALQLVENAQREDIHPLDEADGYRALLDRHHFSLEEIAAHVGKSVTTIRQRLALSELAPEVKDALVAAKISTAVALLLARIPHADLQQRALKECVSKYTDGDLVSAHDAAWTIKTKYMLRIQDAQFDLADPALVKGAPSCATCTKRTGNQTELFADVAGKDDLCTSPPCFEKKKEAHWAKTTKAAAAKGATVLSPKQAKGIFSWGGHLQSKEFVDLEAKTYDGNGRAKPAKSLMGNARDVPRVLARDDAGNVRELVRAEDYRAAVKAAGNDLPARGGQLDAKTRAKAKAEREKAKAVREAFEASLAELRAAAGDGPPDGLWHALARACVRMVWSEVVSETCKCHGLETGKGDSKSDALLSAIPNMLKSDAAGLAIELVVRGARHDRDATLAELRAVFDVAELPAAPTKGGTTKGRKTTDGQRPRRRA